MLSNVEVLRPTVLCSQMLLAKQIFLSMLCMEAHGQWGLCLLHDHMSSLFCLLRPRISLRSKLCLGSEAMFCSFWGIGIVLSLCICMSLALCKDLGKCGLDEGFHILSHLWHGSCLETYSLGFWKHGTISDPKVQLILGLAMAWRIWSCRSS